MTGPERIADIEKRLGGYYTHKGSETMFQFNRRAKDIRYLLGELAALKQENQASFDLGITLQDANRSLLAENQVLREQLQKSEQRKL